MYRYLISSLILLLVWYILFLYRKDLRKDMLFASLIALPFGLTEFFFVPNYWHPKTLFASTLDIESFIFLFAIGGIASVMYEVILNKHLKKERESRSKRLSHFLVFVTLTLTAFILLNMIIPGAFRDKLIYTWTLAGFIGGIAIIIVRKDLLHEVILGSVLFMLLYFFSLLIFNSLIFPGWISDEWNLANLSGIFIFNIPIEELLFALSFGVLWAPIYEFIQGFRSR